MFHNFDKKKTSGRLSFGRPRRRWEDNTIMDLKKMRSEPVLTLIIVSHRNIWC